MHDLTCKEFIQIVNNSKASHSTKELLKRRLIPRNGKFNENAYVFDAIDFGTYYFITECFEALEDDFKGLLKYTKWKKHFKEDSINYVNSYSGSRKNERLLKIYNIIKQSPELSLNDESNNIYFLSLFNQAIKITAKIEEDSIVKIMYDMFKNKESLNIELFKEIFAIYIENINTDPKYQKRINDIKDWGSTQDFTLLSQKYKNIRNIFDTENEEKVYLASSKKYDLKAIAKQTKTKLTVINQNFNYLNNFITEKLKTNPNIHDFIIRDEKIFYKVLIIYEKRDSVIDACIKMHESLFSMISKSEDLETSLIQNLWDKMMMKVDIEDSLNNVNKDKTEKPKKVTKL